MLVASSAQGHSCIYVSLTNGWSWFQVPRDKRLLSVSKASESQEDQDKRYDNIYRNMPDSPDNSFFMFLTMIVLNYNFYSWEDMGVKKPNRLLPVFWSLDQNWISQLGEQIAVFGFAICQGSSVSSKEVANPKRQRWYIYIYIYILAR